MAVSKFISKGRLRVTLILVTCLLFIVSNLGMFAYLRYDVEQNAQQVARSIKTLISKQLKDLGLASRLSELSIEIKYFDSNKAERALNDLMFDRLGIKEIFVTDESSFIAVNSKTKTGLFFSSQRVSHEFSLQNIKLIEDEDLGQFWLAKISNPNYLILGKSIDADAEDRKIFAVLDSKEIFEEALLGRSLGRAVSFTIGNHAQGCAVKESLFESNQVCAVLNYAVIPVFFKKQFVLLNLFIALVAVIFGLGYLVVYWRLIVPNSFFLRLISSVEDKTKSADLIENLPKSLSSHKKNLGRLIGAVEDSAKAHVAYQVAHDIRSPLAALSVVSRDLSQIPEEKRILLRSAVLRIQDIANNLIKSAQKSQSESVTEDSVLVSGVVDSIVTEKRTQYRSKLGIDIFSRLERSGFGYFAKVSQVELSRVISNLINNSVEAMRDCGQVTVTVGGCETSVKIIVSDNGSGIPPDVLEKLGQKGETHGKEGGSGLGLYHAKTTVESWGGKLSIESEQGFGTKVSIVLPRLQTPEWFVSKLSLTSGQSIVVLDDDETIHRIWSSRFDSLGVNSQNVAHLASDKDLSTWLSSNAGSDAIFLIDYEINGSQNTGLDLIEIHGLKDRAILVTSRFEEQQIRTKCGALGVRLIPKNMVEHVEIEISAQASSEKLVVLVDDDELIRNLWINRAASQNINLKTFPTVDAFTNAAENFEKDCPIYLDVSLGEGEDGVAVARSLNQKGFSNLWLCTGYDSESFIEESYLKGVISKAPPF